MSKEVRGNQMHLALDGRIYIEKALDKDISFKDIARLLHKEPTTISKEVKKNRVYKQRNSYSVAPNDCIFKRECQLQNVCNFPIPCNKYCAQCTSCNKRCSKYTPGTCKNFDKAPYVCNGCGKQFQCRMDKYYYKNVSHLTITNRMISR